MDVMIGDENAAPVDFQVYSSSSSSESGDNCTSFEPGGFLEGGRKCPLCLRLRNTFTCKECLLRGEFNHSSPLAGRLRDRFCELKLKLLKLRRRRNELAGQCGVYTERREALIQIVEEMERCEKRIGVEKELKTSLQQRIADVERESENLRRSSAEKDRRLPMYRSRLDNMASAHRHKLAKLAKFSQVVKERQIALQSVSKTRVHQLKNYVFPLQPINPTQTSPSHRSSSFPLLDEEEEEEDEVVSSLMVATSNYWGGGGEEVLPSFGGASHGFGTLGPTLPISGDYSAYVLGAEPMAGAGQGMTLRNPAHSIAAALTYTTQFVNLVAYYLDLRLPHRLSFSEFTVEDLPQSKFNRKVAKLNANVIHLCASQGIPPTFLQPRLTVSNLLTLFDPELADLGRRGPFEVGSQLAKSMEDSIEKDLVMCEGEGNSDSEVDGDPNFPSDWEKIQRGTITEEESPQNMTNHNQSYFSNPYSTDSFTKSRTNANASNGIVSSFTSFFRGWGK